MTEAISDQRSLHAPIDIAKRSRSRKLVYLICLMIALLVSCAEPVVSGGNTGPTIPSIDDDASISLVTWNIQDFPQSGSKTIARVGLIMDSLDADFYCLQEIRDKSALQDVVNGLDQYSVIISDDTYYLHLAIIYKQEYFLPVDVTSLFVRDDDNFAGRPPLKIAFAYELAGKEQVLNLIDLHMKCCEEFPSDLERRHDASVMLHDYIASSGAEGDSNFVVLGDWNDDIHDPDNSGQYAFEPFLNDRENFYFVTDSLAATRSVRNASYPSWNSFLDNILISRSLFDEFTASHVKTLLLDEVFGDYTTVVSDHRPVLWSFKPN
ncbi:MAG: hypothetical protein K9N35_10365 [Candidatus Marinimicrobia bacterium]|nr:hypothetical protein [Candidatus Neomarinimicrobiota bacterium]